MLQSTRLLQVPIELLQTQLPDRLDIQSYSSIMNAHYFTLVDNDYDK
jgi:hypothetical protein